ncbi:MAG TPA: DUF58 domain-containing protein [Polyangiaceae bacterium]
MQVHPTRTSVDLAITGLSTVLAGLVLQQAVIVAWGSSLLVGLALARAVTEIGVARIRGAGFEMLWREKPRTVRVARAEAVEIQAEVRNRDSRAARFSGLRAVASPELSIEIVPERGEVPGGGRLAVTLRVVGTRAGRFGIHGLSLEVQGGPGLYEVPLTFANPYGVDVMPRAYKSFAQSARGGRSHQVADRGRPGVIAGGGDELRELRELVAGDPFRRIAWKASAKRGKLLVREYEREERDIVWLVLDASCELLAGAPGRAPLDVAIDEVATFAVRHAARGDRVGLAIVAARARAFITPDRGPGHTVKLLSALGEATSVLDADRCGLDANELASRALEHMRPLDPASASRVRASELERVARRADRLRVRAPFKAGEVLAATRTDRSLRRYLASFGIGVPARLEPERGQTDLELIRLLRRLPREKPKPSLIYLWSPAPDPDERRLLLRALAELPRRRQLAWLPMRLDAGLEASDSDASRAAVSALAVRARVQHERGLEALARLGVRVERVSLPAVQSALRIEHQHVAVERDLPVDPDANVPDAEQLPGAQ